ncbi:hypothetical protein M422DRAFT_257922 [Sphaerobolus stellatus SS14]|uniref:Uncharacterized protein n=1 Tax=Sphaerobolus stellatus (strain SS14) TaxID=990650 RepID=A0A0C9VCU2_SPHS4|nr:hypothetical protein M422DRAFT_257922 [Sphaerobolus stellatus SS14]
MSTHHSCKQVEELSTLAVGEDEPLQGFTLGELMDPPSTSVDPQQSFEVFAQEHLGDQNARVHSPQTVPIRVQSPIGVAGAAGTSAPNQHLSRVAKASGTATPEKLYSDADSVTTVSQSMTALDANAQYWSDLSNKAACCGHRALGLQLKMAEEKVNILLHEEAPEETLLEAAWEAHTIHFQLDQNTCLREAGLMPEQQVRFRTDTGGNGAVVNRTTEYSGIQQMVRQAVQNASHEAEPEKSFLAKAGVKMGNPPIYGSKVQLQFLGQCLTDEAQEWFYRQVEQFDQEIKHWDLESIIMGLQKWFMLTLLMNKVAVNYDTIMQGSMTMQQHHQELLKLAKQMIELPDAYSYRRRFMNVLKPDIREQVLKKGFIPEFSSIDELVDEAVTLDNAKHYTSGCNSNHGSSYLQKAAIVEHSHAQHTTTQNKSSTNQNAGSSNQHKSGNKPIQNCQTTQLLSTGGGGCHIQPNCPFPDKDRRVAGARIEEVSLEESDEDTPHPEEQQDWEDQPEEDDQQYHFDDDEYKMRSIDNEVVRVNAVIKDSGYNDHCRLYGIRVWEAETDLSLCSGADRRKGTAYL